MYIPSEFSFPFYQITILTIVSVSISDVVIWGYAENGVGMIVGCIATLRPLFRRVFNLGGDSTIKRNQKSHPTVWPGNNSRATGKADEWMALKETNGMNDTGSEEHMLGNRIRVTKSVVVH